MRKMRSIGKPHVSMLMALTGYARLQQRDDTARRAPYAMPITFDMPLVAAAGARVGHQFLASRAARQMLAPPGNMLLDVERRAATLSHGAAMSRRRRGIKLQRARIEAALARRDADSLPVACI